MTNIKLQKRDLQPTFLFTAPESKLLEQPKPATVFEYESIMATKIDDDGIANPMKWKYLTRKRLERRQREDGWMEKRLLEGKEKGEWRRAAKKRVHR